MRGELEIGGGGGPARRARVAWLRREVQAGRYEPDLHAVAEAVIREVDLTAVRRPPAPRPRGAGGPRLRLARAA